MLLEEHEFFRGVILEASDGAYPSMVVQGIYQLGDVRNRNKRVYPNSLWERLVGNDSDLMQRIARRRVVGEMAHPKDGKGYYPNSSHLVTKIWPEKGRVDGCEVCEKQSQPGHLHVIGQEEVLNTPHGSILRELYKRDIEVGISSRGSGSLRSTGRDESVVQDDYKCETWDHVSDPSTPGCWPKTVNESLTDIVGALMDPVCDVQVLQQYRDVMEQAAGSLTESTDSQSRALQLIEAIDRKLASPACTAAASTIGPPKGGWPEFSNNESPTKATEITEVKDMEKYSLDSPEIQRLIDGRLREMKAEFDAELVAVLQRADALEKEKTSLATSVQNHEQAGRELATRLREATMKVKAYEDWANEQSEGGDPSIVDQHNELQGKHSLALQVIDELVCRVRKYKVFEKKSEMAVKVLGETIARERRRDIVDHVNALLYHESETLAAEIRGDLLCCESIADVNKQYGTIKRSVGALHGQTRIEESTAMLPTKRMRPEGKMPSTAGQVNEDHQERIDESKLPPSRVAAEGNQINESVALARQLTRKVNPHRAVVSVAS